MNNEIRYENCPICESKMKNYYYCDNGCIFRGFFDTTIFDESIPYQDENYEYKIGKWIEYWKENDRYLIKILNERE